MVTDTKVKEELYKSLVAAVYIQGGEPGLLIIPPPAAFGSEPSPIAAAAMLESDLLIAACSIAISHTEYFRRAHEKGMRYLAMGGLTLDLLTNDVATAD